MELVEKMIESAFKELLQLDCIGQPFKSENKSKLVFPMRREGKGARVSEQEMRFLFVKQLEKQNQYVYAVEVPTAKKYKFAGDGAPKIDEEDGQSGNIDVGIYDKSTSTFACLIEFKALNPEQDSYSKDFLKLLCDEKGLTNYFVQVIKNSDSGTILNIEEKYRIAISYAKEPISYVKIFLCDIGKQSIIIYEVVNQNIQQKKQYENNFKKFAINCCFISK